MLSQLLYQHLITIQHLALYQVLIPPVGFRIRKDHARYAHQSKDDHIAYHSRHIQILLKNMGGKGERLPECICKHAIVKTADGLIHLTEHTAQQSIPGQDRDMARRENVAGGLYAFRKL